MIYDQSLGKGDTFTSVLSSLQNQRRRIDVIGTNISNINTVGYKSSRMTFLEMMGQTVGKTYTPFEQGSFSATGSTTDLAIDGQSFFVLKDASGDYVYSRAGAFFFDENGKLVNQNGEAVQGWMKDNIIDVDSVTTYGATDLRKVGAVSDLQLDPNMTVDAIATSNIWLSGNINAGLNSVTNIMQAASTLRTDTGFADETTDLNDLSQTLSPLQIGDQITISGTDHDGTAITPVSFSYGGADGTTVGDFLTKINDAFSGVATASISDGKIILTDDVTGASSTSLTLTSEATNVGNITLPEFTVKQKGVTPTSTASIIVYDGYGTAHQLSIEFAKTPNEREWAWTASVEGDQTIKSGGSGLITFDADGNFVGNSFDDQAGSLVISNSNGSDDLDISIFAGGTDGVTPMSQYDSITTVTVRQQDGQGAGSLEGININEDGYIVGTFSNSVVMNLAQIALAEFDDPTSLDKVGVGNFSPTNDSGDAQLGRANDFSTTIMSGHLETSNVDLADQFIQMLDAQQAYSASSRIVATLDQVMQETTQFGR